MDCTHIFIGRVDGVHCMKCGCHMSAEEYNQWLRGSSVEEIRIPAIELQPKPKRQQRKRGAKDE